MMQRGNLITQAARRVLSLSCYTQARQCTGAGSGSLQPDILALVSMVGDLDLTLTLALPRRTAEALATSFAGFPIAFGTTDMADAIGELANILAGAISALLDEQGVRTQISLPSVMSGQNLIVQGPKNADIFESHLDSTAGPLCVGTIAERSHSSICT